MKFNVIYKFSAKSILNNNSKGCIKNCGEEMEPEKKIIAIETKIAYLENFINELNFVIIEQEKSIKKLISETEVLKKKISASGSEKLPENERPPHY